MALLQNAGTVCYKNFKWQLCLGNNWL